MAKIFTKNGAISSSAGIEILAGVTASMFIDSTGVGIRTTVAPSSSLDIEDGYVLLPEGPSASVVPPGKVALYVSSSDSKVYAKTDAGVVYDLTDSGSGGSDADAIHDNVAGEIAVITEKTSIIGGDWLIIEDSADSNNKKSVRFGNLTGSAGADELAKVSSNDTTAGYLNGKIVAGSNITLNERSDGGNETLEISASVGGRTDYGNSATDPGGAAEGEKYYNTILEKEMRYDGLRSKWLSIESSIFEFGKTGNAAAGSYFRGPDSINFSATQGFTTPFSGTVVAFGYNRTDTDAAIFQIVEDGAEIAFLSSSAVEGVDNTLDGDFTPTGSLAVLNKTGGNTVSNAFGWVMVKWRI